MYYVCAGVCTRVWMCGAVFVCERKHEYACVYITVDHAGKWRRKQARVEKSCRHYSTVCGVCVRGRQTDGQTDGLSERKRERASEREIPDSTHCWEEKLGNESDEWELLQFSLTFPLPPLKNAWTFYNVLFWFVRWSQHGLPWDCLWHHSKLY